MKLRIKGNTLRLRLTKSEVDYFSENLLIEEQINFTGNKLTYALKASDQESISSSFEKNRITVFIPVELAKDWTTSNMVGCSGEMSLEGDKKLYILVEKDFKCLDEVAEDQSDNYENPHAIK